jgi:hypothetical protein
MRALPIAVAALAAALVLTACDDSGSKKTTSDTKSGKTGKTSSTAKKTPGACAVGDFGMEVAANAAPAAGDTGNLTVTLTNHGAKCTLKGYPAIDVNGGSSTTNIVNEQGGQPVALSPATDETASFTITYVRGEEGGTKSFDAKTLRVGLPGASAAHSIPWSYGPIAGKDQGVDLNASVSPFQQAGD